MLQVLLACILLVLAALPSAAQERPATEQKRGAYVVKYAGAKDLVAILVKHFKGAAESQAGPEGTNNTLLVNAPPAVFDEVMKLIEQLDGKPQSVAVEVFVIELPAKKADDKDAAGIDEKDLSGAIDGVAKTLEALQKKGQVASVKRIQLTAQEGRAASLVIGEAKPFSAGGGATNYRNVGTQVRVTPQVAADKTVTVELSVQDSRMVIPEDGGAPEFPTMSLTSKLGVASGKAVLAKDAKATEKSAAGRTIIVVGARLVEPK
jgi:type II secretory pathway component GspD/PulD (secretin)